MPAREVTAEPLEYSCWLRVVVDPDVPLSVKLYITGDRRHDSRMPSVMDAFNKKKIAWNRVEDLREIGGMSQTVINQSESQAVEIILPQKATTMPEQIREIRSTLKGISQLAQSFEGPRKKIFRQFGEELVVNSVVSKIERAYRENQTKPAYTSRFHTDGSHAEVAAASRLTGPREV
jgi:hypothetical protein